MNSLDSKSLNLKILPDEIWLNIFNHSLPEELLRIQSICKEFHRLCSSNELWKDPCHLLLMGRMFYIIPSKINRADLEEIRSQAIEQIFPKEGFKEIFKKELSIYRETKKTKGFLSFFKKERQTSVPKSDSSMLDRTVEVFWKNKILTPLKDYLSGTLTKKELKRFYEIERIDELYKEVVLHVGKLVTGTNFEQQWLNTQLSNSSISSENINFLINFIGERGNGISKTLVLGSINRIGF